MHPDELLDALRAEATAMAAVASSTDLSRAVPTCPGWDLGQLVNHTGRVHRWATAMVRDRATERADFPPRPDTADAAWLEAGAADLVAALEEAGPDAAVWTFPGGGGTTRFWFRRQAEETAVHRWDAEGAAGARSPIETELALAGIDEILDVFFTGRSAAGLAGTVHLHATDSPHGEWLVRADPDAPDQLLIGHDHAKGDVALRATASDLLLWLWGRPVPDGDLEVFGDRTILEWWRAQLRIG